MKTPDRKESFDAELALETATDTVACLSALWGLRVQDSDRKDIAARAVANAWENRALFDPQKASFKTWIGRIARNCLLDHLKRRRSVRDKSVPEENPEFAKSPDVLMMECEGMETIAQILSELPDDVRIVIDLLSEGKRPKDMAIVLKCTPNAAAIRCCRARKVLREKLRERNGQFSSIC